MIKPTDEDFNQLSFELELITNMGKCLVVEGISDKLFFKMFKYKYNVTLFSINGQNPKKTIIELNSNLKLTNNENIFYIIDRDFDLSIQSSKNFLVTEFYDIENYYFQFSSFEHYLSKTFNSEDIMKVFFVANHKETSKIRESIYLKISGLTALRKMNEIHSLELPIGIMLKKSPASERRKRHKFFKGLLDTKFEFSMSNFLDRLTSYAYDKYTNIELLEMYNKEKKQTKKNCANGHDLISLVSVILNSMRIRKNDLDVECDLALCVSEDNFLEFSETSRILNWISS